MLGRDRCPDARRSDPAYRLVLTVVTCLAWLSGVVPWPVWHLTASIAGAAGMSLGWRHVVLGNVRHARAGHQPRPIVAWFLGMQQIASHCKTVISVLRARPGSEGLGDGFKIVGLEHLDTHLGRRGIVVVAPHAGPYPTLGLTAGEWLRGRGYTGEIAVVVRLFEPLGTGALTGWFTGQFARSGVTIVNASDSPQRIARTLLTVLRNRGVVILFVDEPGPSASIPVPFFDSRIAMPTGPARLARATRSVILPCMATYGPSRTSTLTIEPGIEAAESDAETLCAVARSMEGLIRRHLDQWSMLTPIWLEEATMSVPENWSLADLHLHTVGSDGLCSVADWVAAAEEAGVAVIGVTDHDHLETVRNFKPGDREGGAQVIPGVEVTARGRIVHVGVLFPGELPDRLLRPGTPLLAVLRWARSVPGSIVVLVHPLPLLWRVQLRRMARAGLLPDAIETRFPLVGWRADRLEKAAAGLGLARLGGSDAHLAPGQLGRHVAAFPGASIDDLVAAIRARETRAITLPKRIGRLPVRLYLVQCAYSWLLPFQGSPRVAAVRTRLLDTARRQAAMPSGAERGTAHPSEPQAEESNPRPIG